MENSTGAVSFVLGMYGNAGSLKYLYFTLATALYASAIVANALLVAVIRLDPTLHEPMYLLLCSLFAGEVCGSTALLPCLMAQVLSDTHEISLFFCLLQIFSIQTYVSIEFRTLAAMAYDRYACICRPLHYNAIMTKRRVQVAIVALWAASCVEVGLLLSFVARLTFCGTVINKVCCGYHFVVALSCSPAGTLSFVNDVVFGLAVTVAAPVCFISFTYAKILSVCVAASAEARAKALDTCTPHLVSITSFVFSCFYNLVSQRFDMTPAPLELRVVLSMYAFLIQPVLNPLIYGLRLTKIRQALKKL